MATESSELPKRNPRLIQIDGDICTFAESPTLMRDEMLRHLPGNVGTAFVPVHQRDTKHGAGQTWVTVPCNSTGSSFATPGGV